MTQLAHKPNPNTGLARRAENYQQLLEECSKNTGSNATMHQAMQAATLISSEIGAPAALLLITYLNHIDFKSGNSSSVWPSSSRVALTLGTSESSIRRNKQRLEKAGLILRKYDQRNRPIHGDAIDLTPFLQKVPGILADHKKAIAELKEEKAQLRAHRIDLKLTKLNSKMSGQAPKNERHRNSTQNPVGNVPSLNEGDKSLFEKAVQLSPRLNKFLSSKDATADMSKATNVLEQGIDQLLAAPLKNNLSSTWGWGIRRFGAGGTILRLAIVLETPKVRSMVKYFGSMITNTDFDIETNIERIKANQASQKPDFPPQEGRGFQFAEKLCSVIGDVEAFNNWFGSKITQYSDDSEVLTILVSSHFRKNEISSRFGNDLSAARESLEWHGYKIRLAIMEKRS